MYPAPQYFYISRDCVSPPYTPVLVSLLLMCKLRLLSVESSFNYLERSSAHMENRYLKRKHGLNIYHANQATNRTFIVPPMYKSSKVASISTITSSPFTILSSSSIEPPPPKNL